MILISPNPITPTCNKAFGRGTRWCPIPEIVSIGNGKAYTHFYTKKAKLKQTARRTNKVNPRATLHSFTKKIKRHKYPIKQTKSKNIG